MVIEYDFVSRAKPPSGLEVLEYPYVRGNESSREREFLEKLERARDDPRYF